MGNIVKVLTGILGILAVIACLATIGVIGYTLMGAGGKNTQTVTTKEETQDETETSPVPSTPPETDNPDGAEPTIEPVNLTNHTHDYRESIEKKATCYQAGRLAYTCKECGDVYYVDVLSTGHVEVKTEKNGSVEFIPKANAKNVGVIIYPGQKIRITESTVSSLNPMPQSNYYTYTVQRGDSLWRIARRFRVSVRYLVRINNIQNPNLIYPGQVLKI